MLNEKIIPSLIVLVSCIPFVYLAMAGDVETGSLAMYGSMILSFIILTGVALKTGHVSYLLIGNVLSFAASTLFIFLNQTETWDWYFKPLSAFGLLILVSVLLLIGQLFAVFTVFIIRRWCSRL